MDKGIKFWYKYGVYWFPVQGILSALVLSIIPLIRPYRWQSLLMPVISCFFCWVIFTLESFSSILMQIFQGYEFNNNHMQVLPNDMMEFLDAPVPYIVSFPQFYTIKSRVRWFLSSIISAEFICWYITLFDLLCFHKFPIFCRIKDFPLMLQCFSFFGYVCLLPVRSNLLGPKNTYQTCYKHMLMLEYLKPSTYSCPDFAKSNNLLWTEGVPYKFLA